MTDLNHLTSCLDEYIKANERRKHLYTTSQECKTYDEKCKFIDEYYGEISWDLDEDTMNMEADFKIENNLLDDDIFSKYFKSFNYLKSRDERENASFEFFKNCDQFNDIEKAEIETILLEEIMNFRNKYPDGEKIIRDFKAFAFDWLFPYYSQVIQVNDEQIKDTKKKIEDKRRQVELKQRKINSKQC